MNVNMSRSNFNVESNTIKQIARENCLPNNLVDKM